jgi:hypothetical protein
MHLSRFSFICALLTVTFFDTVILVYTVTAVKQQIKSILNRLAQNPFLVYPIKLAYIK